jgi:hypothetical protein
MLPPMFDAGVDPALKILSLLVVFARPPRAKRTIEAAIPPPLRAHVRWLDGHMLHVHTIEYNEVDIRLAYDRRVRAYVTRHGLAIDSQDARDLVRDELDAEATTANLRAFWRDVARFLAACGELDFVVTSAPLEIRGYDKAVVPGRATLANIVVPRLTALLRKGVAKDDYLPGNVAFGVALIATGDSDRAVALDSVTRARFVALIEAALETTDNATKLWLKLLARVAPDHARLKRKRVKRTG